MANLVTLEIKAPPATIDIDVAFYDDDEKAALQSSALSPAFENLPKRLSVPIEDFCAFYLYYKMRRGVAGFTNHTEIAKKWHQALVEFDGQVDFGESSIHALSLDNSSTGTTERLGEAVGLSIASQLHDLHQADWARIPIAHTKTSDFRRNIASDAVNFLEVETKGSIVADITKKAPTVSGHKASIKEKKNQLRENGDSRTVMYGTIAVMDNRPSSVAKCWLVDPPAAHFENPRQFKILARLEYIAELISLLGGRSPLAASLQTRLSALRALPDISPLDSVPLRRGNGKEYSYGPYMFSGHNSWFSSKTVVSDGPTGGQLDLVRPDLMFFIGIREELVEYTARQDFERIATYGFASGSLKKKLDCAIPKGRFQSEFAPFLDVRSYVAQDEGGYVRFRLPALLHYTQSGLVFGTASVPSDWRK